MKPTLNTTANSSMNTTDPRNEPRISLLAFLLYEQRGREHGHDIEDWLQAEAEITRKSAASSPIESIAA